MDVLVMYSWLLVNVCVCVTTVYGTAVEVTDDVVEAE
jgi:hypothetical protein